MRDQIDQLIHERAPWMVPGAIPALVQGPTRAVLHRLLAYRETIRVAEGVRHLPGAKVMATMFDRIGKCVTVRGLANLPRCGPALIVANHPTGIADGIILHGALSRLRPDLYFLANKDILRVLPHLGNMIAPVEWQREKRSHGKTRETMAFVRQATEDGRIGVIFPSGRLAKRRGLRLHERPWMTSAATLARKLDLPVVPVHISARNSALFYLFDLLHPTLRDVTLFHETLNKARQPFALTLGEPISASALPADPAEGIAMLRAATLGLAEEKDRTVSLIRASRPLLPG